MKVLCIPQNYTGGISWHFLSSLCLSVCLSSFLEFGVKTVQGICTKFSEWIELPCGRVVLHLLFRGARHMWHVSPCKGLQIFLTNPTGQMGGPTDPKFAGHTYTAPTYVLLWLPFLWGAGCTCQGRKTCYVASSCARKFLTRDAKLDRWVDLDMVYLVPYNLMGWNAVCAV